MNNSIAQLWNGNIAPINGLGKNNYEAEQLEELIDHILKGFGEGLTKQQEEQFEKLVNNANEYISMITQEAFCDGFSVGTKLIIDAMTRTENIL